MKITIAENGKLLSLSGSFASESKQIDLSDISSKVSLVEFWPKGVVRVHSPDFLHQGSSPYSSWFATTEKEMMPHLTSFIGVRAYAQLVPRDLVFSEEPDREDKIEEYLNGEAERFSSGGEEYEGFNAFVNPAFFERIEDRGNYRRITVRCADPVATLMSQSEIELLFKTVSAPAVASINDPRP